jgi:hypothetical protein
MGSKIYVRTPATLAGFVLCFSERLEIKFFVTKKGLTISRKPLI